jgi:hypothetical protein
VALFRISPNPTLQITGLDAPRVERPSTPWGQALNDKNVVCYREVVMTGSFGYVLPDVETAFDLRKAMYGSPIHCTCLCVFREDVGLQILARCIVNGVVYARCPLLCFAAVTP